MFALTSYITKFYFRFISERGNLLILITIRLIVLLLALFELLLKFIILIILIIIIAISTCQSGEFTNFPRSPSFVRIINNQTIKPQTKLLLLLLGHGCG